MYWLKNSNQISIFGQKKPFCTIKGAFRHQNGPEKVFLRNKFGLVSEKMAKFGT